MNNFSNKPGIAESQSLTDRPSWSHQELLFIHIPKSGGTTLDSIFRDHYFDVPLLPSTPFDLFGHYVSKFNDPSYRYIGGHYPLSTIDSGRFHKKITVLRNPLDSICSGISYVNKLDGLPQEALTASEKSGLPALTYKKFFTTHFDTDRYLIDLNYGVAKGMRNYLFECAADEAFENIKNFTHVFDFEYFDVEVKRFLMQEQYFPYAKIAKKRQYSYQPDYARAKPLLSEFDEQFYNLGVSLFKKVDDNIDCLYEQYREDYCRNRGLALHIHEGRSLDLRMPLGAGWHHAEQTEKNNSFRWSEPAGASIEIPIATAGLYAIYLYIHPAEMMDLNFSIFTDLHPQEFSATLLNDKNILIYRILVSTRSHDWINIVINMQKDSQLTPAAKTVDVRELGIILSNVYVCRHPL